MYCSATNDVACMLLHCLYCTTMFSEDDRKFSLLFPYIGIIIPIPMTLPSYVDQGKWDDPLSLRR